MAPFRLDLTAFFSAFTLPYACFEIPTAWWTDRIGSRRVLTRIVVWWSGFTMLTGAAFKLPGAVGDPVSVRRGRSRSVALRGARVQPLDAATGARPAQGIFFAGAHLAGGLTPALVVWIATFLPWRLVFGVFGLAGWRGPRSGTPGFAMSRQNTRRSARRKRG